MAKKARADQLVFPQGLAESREQAKRLIMAGQVLLVEGERLVTVDKSGRQLEPEARFELTGRERFVSRGVVQAADGVIDHFGLDVEGCVRLDADASTGGFTDCLLQHGAARVYAVDVGRHQLHERLRADGRVISLEGVNLRHAEPLLISEPVDVVVADVSFISLTLVLVSCMQWLKESGRVAALIKPQFEVGPGGTDRGVVRDPALREQAVAGVLAFAEDRLSLHLAGVVPSAFKGPKGNQEYMAVWTATRPLFG